MLKYAVAIIVFLIIALGGYYLYVVNMTQRASIDTTDWKTTQDNGFTYKYPDTLPAHYIHAVDWPPKLVLSDGPFACTQASEETQSAGRTEKHVINGMTYCVTKESQGAAGSIYTMYAYAFPKNDRVAILTFSTQSVNCDNYDDPDKSACLQERSSFNLDPIVDTIARTIK